MPTIHSGVSIELTRDLRHVWRFTSEKYLTAGVARLTHDLLSPVNATRGVTQESLIEEFEDLLSRDPREDALERFLAAHYVEIFGARYDRIETQVWLRFPTLDINAKNRQKLYLPLGQKSGAGQS